MYTVVRLLFTLCSFENNFKGYYTMLIVSYTGYYWEAVCNSFQLHVDQYYSECSSIIMTLFIDCFNFLAKYSYYSEPMFCSLGIIPFVTSVVNGGLAVCGSLFTSLFIDKVRLSIMRIHIMVNRLHEPQLL